jgi:hypothetical protein
MDDYFAYAPAGQPNAAPEAHATAAMQGGTPAPSSAEVT